MISKWEYSNAKWGIGDRENLADALQIIDRLLSTTELNMDELDQDTMLAIDAASRFQHAAANQGFKTTGFHDAPPDNEVCGRCSKTYGKHYGDACHNDGNGEFVRTRVLR